MKEPLVLVVALLLSAQPSSCEQISSLGCTAAYYMLRNSVPRSCNSALDQITASLMNGSQEIDSGDICSSYCITPLKQAAQDCTDIHDIYTAVSLRCCQNEHGEQCNSLTGHAALVHMVSECSYYVNLSSPYNCSNACSHAMTSAAATLGCCLPALMTSSVNEGLLDPGLWGECHGQTDTPTALCTQCSTATLCSRRTLSLMAIATLFVTLLT